MRLADLGIVNAGLYLCDRALQRISGARAFLKRYYLVAQPVAGPMRLPQRLGASFTARGVAGDAAAACDFPRPRAVIAARYQHGSECIALFREERLVAFIWLHQGPYEEDEVRCTFAPAPPGAAAWDYDVYVVPEHRNGIAFMRLWSAALAHLRERGIGWSMSRISAFATESLAAHRRLGAIRVGQAVFLVLFRLQVMVATVPPFLHLSLGPHSRPVLTVRAPAAG